MMSFPAGSYFWITPSLLPATQTLPARSTKQPWIEPGTVFWSPQEAITSPAGLNLMIDGAEVEVCFSSSVMSARLTTKTLSPFASMQTPPSRPVIQSPGRSFGHFASISNRGNGLRRSRLIDSADDGNRRNDRGAVDHAHGLPPYSNFRPPI